MVDFMDYDPDSTLNKTDLTASLRSGHGAIAARARERVPGSALGPRSSVDSSRRPVDEPSCCLLDVLGGRGPICAARP
jgi:hypothetical protein